MDRDTERRVAEALGRALDAGKRIPEVVDARGYKMAKRLTPEELGLDLDALTEGDMSLSERREAHGRVSGYITAQDEEIRRLRGRIERCVEVILPMADDLNILPILRALGVIPEAEATLAEGGGG